ncbi:TPA: orotidine 5'-phosphate decarboxylase / HUMPS family protein [Escherichia coli]
MSLPMLQVALDNQTMDSAYETTRLIAEEVDIIEVGTILCVGEGVRAVRDLKALYPHKIVLADAKIADAGKILSRMCFEANADWVTVICCADINTAKGALDVAKEFNGDVQIELTGYPLMNSISKALGYAHYLNNPWFQLYPDIGNLSAWDNDVQMELQAGIGHIVAVHVKDTKPGVFKNVPFGEGVVDFERCFETLKQSGYCGPYLIEMWSETAEDPAAEVAKARDWVKARMAKAGMVEAA